jgi:hypothetical protein
MMLVAGILTGCGGSKSGDPPTSAAPAVVSGTAAVGAALAGASVSIVDIGKSNVCAESTIVTTGTGEFSCTVLAGKSAPFLITVIDPSGAYQPMVSIVNTTPPAGSTLVANATPLTTAIVAQLAPDRNALSVVADPSLMNANAIGIVTGKVLTQLGAVLSEIGAPANYDPFTTQIVAGTLERAGNTADQVIETLRFDTVNGVIEVSSIDNPSAAVAVADMLTVNPSILPAPSSAVISLADSLRYLSNQLQTCFALPVNTRAQASDTTIPSSQGGPAVTSIAPQCQNSFHSNYVQNGFTLGQRHYKLLTANSMTGAKFSPPEVMRFIDDTSSDDHDIAILNLRYVDANGDVGNIIDIVQKFPGSATTSHPTDWWIYGNQQPVDSSISAAIQDIRQYAPTPGTAPFLNAPVSYFRSAIILTVNMTGPGSTGMRAARIKGPGLPSAGVVLTRPDPSIITGQTYMNIRRKDGLTDPASATFSSTTGPTFYLQRTSGHTGTAATTVQPNPNAGNSNNTSSVAWAHPLDYGAPIGSTTYVDFSQLKSNSTYQLEIFYDGETSPHYTFSKTMLSAVIPAIKAVSLTWIDLTSDTLGFLDPTSPLAAQKSSASIAWILSPVAETVRDINIQTGGAGLTVQSGGVGVSASSTGIVINSPGTSFPALTNDGTSYRSIWLTYRTLDGSVKQSDYRFN